MLDSIKQKLKQINLIEATQYKKAGVLILLLKEDKDAEYKIVFTKRSIKLKTHSGEVSFPGGKWEEADNSLYETALRIDGSFLVNSFSLAKTSASGGTSGGSSGKSGHKILPSTAVQL